ncbi:MAG TPA: T9SS type A sorting domain-containing protein [Paenisporosarcina sp.]|nr:T9SS type A sorting domain-containing protein [Paenisporosarcina sp.]
MKNLLSILIILFAICVPITMSAQLTPIPRQAAIGEIIENKGQVFGTDDLVQTGVKAYTSTQGATAYFLNNKIAHVWFRNDTSSSNNDTLYRMDARLVGCNSVTPTMNDLDTFPGIRNYYLGYLPADVENVHSYSHITYSHIYDSITAKFSNNGLGLNYWFKVSPGGKVGDISITFDSASSITTYPDGDILATTPYGSVLYEKPAAYFFDYATGDTLLIESHFYYDGSTISIQLYQDSLTPLDSILSGILPLYIQFMTSTHFPSGVMPGKPPIPSPTLPPNPDELLAASTNCEIYNHWSTYFGGAHDAVRDTYIDAGNHLYTVGGSQGNYFPVYLALQPGNAGMTDIVIAKFNTSRARKFATYYGGTQHDFGYGVTANTSGEVFVTGLTWSTNFPCFNPGGGAHYVSSNSGNIDAFVVRLKQNGQASLWATYLGGTQFDMAYAITIDINNNIYVGGATSTTSSASTPFPIQSLSGAYNQGTHSGSYDGFITKFTANTFALEWSTYLGGPDNDGINGLVATLNASPGTNLAVKGYSFSTGTILNGPCTGNSSISGQFPVVDPNPSSSADYVQQNSTVISTTDNDIFVAVFNSNHAIYWSTMCGGSGDDALVSSDDIGGISVDVNDNIFITGTTRSTDFPTLLPSTPPGVYVQATHGGGTFDAYIVKFGTNGVTGAPPYAFKYGTYYGGTGADMGIEVAAGTNYVYFAGITNGTIFTTPLPGPFYDGTPNGVSDGFLIQLDATLNFLGASYFGGSSSDITRAISIVPIGGLVNVILAGQTTSSPYQPLQQLPGGYWQSTLAGQANGFITEVRTNCPLRLANPNGPIQSSVISLFPNPTTGEFVVKFDSDSILAIRIYNSLGELVLCSAIYNNVEQEWHLNIAGYAPGIYFVEAETTRSRYFTKVLYQN